MDTEIADIVKIYKDIACIPTVNSAALQVFPDENAIKIHCTWSVSDLIKAESTKFSQEFFLQSKSQKSTLLSKGVPYDVSSVSQCAFTKSRNRFAVFRSKKKDESVFLEIWSLSQKEKTFDMSERKEHGKIYDNDCLNAFEWSANEKYLFYVAEAKQKKSESYFKDVFCDKIDEKPSEESTKGEENLYRETWGESYGGAHHPVLCIFEIETGKIKVLDYIGTSISQATWGPNDEYIVFIGFKETPYRLGLTYCSNRRSSVFSYNLQSKEVVCLTSDGNIDVEYPVFSPNMECFVFLQNKSRGPHRSCRKLMKCDWKDKKISTVIDIIDDAKGEDFAGIYTSSLSSNWWTSDSRFFFFHTFRKSFLEIFYVDILSSEVKKIDIDKSFGSCVLHDVKDPYILISVSSPNLKPHLMLGYFTISGDDGIQVIWNPVDDSLDFCLQDLSWDVHCLKPSLVNKCYPDLDYGIITVASTEKKNGTLIIFPHGGPHSSFWPTLYDHVAAFARLGYIICLVNYRGSLGYGEKSIQSLLGNVGSQDVSDVVQAIEYIKQDKSLGIKQVVGYGGSHGGFLIAHLLGQYPDLLKAAAIRNPVIDFTSMADTSDIPDWCWVESGCSKAYDFLDVKSPSVLDEMWKISPMKNVKNVRTPTLLCLGKNDLRVPSSQGLKFHSYLKALDVPTKVYFYDDSHGLSKVPVTSDNFVQTALWFQLHMP